MSYSALSTYFCCFRYHHTNRSRVWFDLSSPIFQGVSNTTTTRSTMHVVQLGGSLAKALLDICNKILKSIGTPVETRMFTTWTGCPFYPCNKHNV